MWSEGAGCPGAAGNRDLYPDYGEGEGQPSNEEHSRPTLNIVSISRTRDGRQKREKGEKKERMERWRGRDGDTGR